MKKFEKGFERWLKSLSEKELEMVVEKVLTGSDNAEDVKAYLRCVASIEHAVRNCSKCRRRGCEARAYEWALRYAVRNGKPASWWKRTGQAAVMGAARMLSI